MRLSLDALRQEPDRFFDKSDGQDKQKYSPDVCQCCGADVSKVECLCDNLTWFMLPGGGVECQGHRMKRMIDGEARKRFWVFGRK